MLRLTKQQNYLLLSPSRQEVAKQRAPECIPLVMEPMSNLYVNPMIVLAFQSLYPSIIIAYNMCYSTCLGSLAPGEGKNNLKPYGTTVLGIPIVLLVYPIL
eukprot:TRINITY_DN16619_c0_g1_i1.p1 TRINITY_DN16619_c0_g1~~TRINITY_DN16619_c0_g1_i1.p1  ORF type:complete len:101 (-),score=8.55 TRINITY_DN16619_c0_g1_i1:3-305(-)